MNTQQSQIELQWFPEDQPQFAPNAETRKVWVDSRNPVNPFHKYIGNEIAVRRLCRAAYAGLGRYNRCCSDVAFALLGPASTGKTTLARMFAELVDLPFIEISPRSISSINDILVQIAKVLEETVVTQDDGTEVTLELVELPGKRFKLPPCIIFIDEVHALRPNIVQGLLKATEKKDGILITEKGWIVDCKNVCWMIATTDRGSLFDAFDTRFTKINLRLYSLEEIAKIVKINNPDWTLDACQVVARYAGRVPREALAFAAEIRLELEMHDYDSTEDAAAVIAEDNQIDEFGMTHQRVKILQALGQQGPIARNNMGNIAGCKEEELLKFVMPPLLAITPDQEPLIITTGKGYKITESGIRELELRNIPHNFTTGRTNTRFSFDN